MASALTVDTASFMEEIQQYECLYNKFSKNFKNRDMKENCWGKIAEKFAISKLEAQNKFKNTRTVYGRFLRKKKKIPSGSGRDTVPTVPREFTNLEWLQSYINRRTTVSNFGRKSSQGSDIHESDEDLGDESFEFEGDSTVDGYREELSPEDTSTLDLEGTLTEERSKSRPDTPSTDGSSSTDNTDTASRTRNSSGKMKAKQQRPWSLHAKKQGKDEIDLALLKTANSIAEQVNKTSESDNRSQELNQLNCEDSFFCRSLIDRMKRFDPRERAFVRLGIEQLLLQMETQSQTLPVLPPLSDTVSSGMGFVGHTATNLINHVGHDRPFQVRDAELGMNAREVSNDHSYMRL